MKPSRIAATIGAVVLGGLLVASNAVLTSSARPEPVKPVRHAVQHHFHAPAPHQLRPHSTLRMGLHCDSTDMSI